MSRMSFGYLAGATNGLIFGWMCHDVSWSVFVPSLIVYSLISAVVVVALFPMEDHS